MWHSDLLPLRAKGGLTVNYIINTGNVQVQGRAALLEDARDALQQLDHVYHH